MEGLGTKCKTVRSLSLDAQETCEGFFQKFPCPAELAFDGLHGATGDRGDLRMGEALVLAEDERFAQIGRERCDSGLDSEFEFVGLCIP